jgi:chromosome segregation ATPase
LVKYEKERKEASEELDKRQNLLEKCQNQLEKCQNELDTWHAALVKAEKTGAAKEIDYATQRRSLALLAFETATKAVARAEAHLGSFSMHRSTEKGMRDCFRCTLIRHGNIIGLTS